MNNYVPVFIFRYKIAWNDHFPGSNPSSYVITISNCTIDSSNYPSHFVLTNSITIIFIHALYHFECTPVITPSVICYTGNFKAGVSDFFSLIYLFMATFIHKSLVFPLQRKTTHLYKAVHFFPIQQFHLFM